MLVTNRRIGEGLVITLPDGRVIVVKVISVKGQSSCRLGVDAPADVHIRRDELPPLPVAIKP